MLFGWSLGRSEYPYEKVREKTSFGSDSSGRSDCRDSRERSDISVSSEGDSDSIGCDIVTIETVVAVET